MGSAKTSGRTHKTVAHVVLGVDSSLFLKKIFRNPGASKHAMFKRTID